MKLLFDHNLPPGLVTGLRNLFPDPEPVFAIGLDRSSDLGIREYARREGLVRVTKDADFSDMCVLKVFKIHEKEVRSMRLTEMVSCSG